MKLSSVHVLIIWCMLRKTVAQILHSFFHTYAWVCVQFADDNVHYVTEACAVQIF